MVCASNGSEYAAGNIIFKVGVRLDIAPDNIYMIGNTNMTDHAFRNQFYGNGHISEDFQPILMRPVAFNFLLVLVSRKIANIYLTLHRTKIQATEKMTFGHDLRKSGTSPVSSGQYAWPRKFLKLDQICRRLLPDASNFIHFS